MTLQALIDEHKKDHDYWFHAFMIEVGEAIVKHQMLHQISNAELADKMDWTEQRVLDVLRGEDGITINELIQILHTCEVHLDI